MFQEIYTLLYYFFKSEWVKKERLVSPLLFASLVIILFHFIFGEEIARSPSVFVGEIFLTLILVLQITLLRQFDIEKEDNVIEHMRASFVSPFSLFCAKFLLNFLFAFISATAIFLLTKLVNSHLDFSTQNTSLFFLIVFLFIFSTSSLGSLVSAVLSSVTGREILFPLLFYPLLVPVLILSVQTSLMVVVSQLNYNEISTYLLYLAGISSIYFIVSIMLFCELLT